MSKKFTTALRFAAIVSVATTMGTTGALAGDKALSPEIMALTHSIQAQQAVSRTRVMQLVEQARTMGVSPLTVAKLDRGVTVARPSAKQLPADILALTQDIQADQTVRRVALMDMIETARKLDVSPLTVALMEQGNLDIAVSSGPSDD